MTMKTFEEVTKKSKRKNLWKTVGLSSIVGIVLLLSSLYALRLFSNYRSQQAQEHFNHVLQVTYPNVDVERFYVNEIGIVSGYVDYNLSKDVAGVPFAFGHLEVEYNFYGVFANFAQYFPEGSEEYYYHQDSNSKLPVFYNTKTTTGSQELPYVKEMKGQIVEVAITFDKKYTLAEIRNMVPGNLKQNWYWIGTEKSQLRTEYLSLVSLFGTDSEQLQAVTAEVATDDLVPYTSPLTVMKELVDYQGDYALSPEIKGDVQAYVNKFGDTDFTKQEEIDKLEFAGIILTGKAEDFAQLEGKDWIYASSIGASIPIQPYYQLHH
ncbi:anti-sigma factor [Streptococcus suis]|uniref:anti-sigma factor n=2 Tax=Streptococcus suis TaxID=1307 RepID=UPI00211C340D|nr:anti-sigma factor [Streptococcus suis]MCQ9226545.1 anti-sigma factor [Streptococcus suis]MCQ9228819.1 anti-sigma factor [Streptococcus suis]MDE7535115.1 anti-sigma factor [Streptococcus suis]